MCRAQIVNTAAAANTHLPLPPSSSNCEVDPLRWTLSPLERVNLKHPSQIRRPPSSKPLEAHSRDEGLRRIGRGISPTVNSFFSELGKIRHCYLGQRPGILMSGSFNDSPCRFLQESAFSIREVPVLTIGFPRF